MEDSPRFPRTVLAELPGPCGPARSAIDNLAQKRYAAAGDRAYAIGMLDGSFPPIGTRIRGEMGGVWAPPIKLLSGYWLPSTVHGCPQPRALRVAPATFRCSY